MRGDSIQGLSKSARVVLLDYFSAKNLGLAALGFVFNPGKKCYICPPENESKGWVKRIQNHVKSVFGSDDPAKLTDILPISASFA